MKILLYVEPHPVRDSFEEFSGIGAFLAEALLKQIGSEDFDLRIFSNNPVIDLICNKVPQAVMICERPTGAESKIIENYKSAWGQSNIDKWIDLTNGIGPASEFYISILERIHQKYAFDAVLLWSENGAVRKFCQSKEIVALHGELGPTRPPFIETMYFDQAGTNGNAAVRKAVLDQLNLRKYPIQTWLGPKSRFENNPEGIGIVDVPYTAVPDEITSNVKFPYIFVPLQLADDLNTIKNSEFSGPLDFLQKILPTFIDQGYHVVIKPHPGSLSRPFNLIEETKALIYARQFEDNVTIIDRTVTITRSLRIMSQSAFVCTINSSVGYEAMLMGKRPLILGDAMYDIGGELKVTLDAIARLEAIPDHTTHIKRLFNFLSGHILISKDMVATGKPVVDILKFIRDSRDNNINTESAEFWGNWIQKFKYGINWLGEACQPSVAPTEHGEIFGNLRLLSGKEKTILIKDGTATLTAKTDKHSIIAGSANVLDKLFIGNIDLISPVEGKPGVTRIEGWAIDEKIRQAALVLVIKDDKVISHQHLVVPRLDAADYLRNVTRSPNRAFPTNCGFRIDIPTKTAIDNTYTIALITADNTLFVTKGETGPITR